MMEGGVDRPAAVPALDHRAGLLDRTEQANGAAHDRSPTAGEGAGRCLHRGVAATPATDQTADAKARLDAGTITGAEFAALKAKALG